MSSVKTVNVVGAGISGLSASITLARMGISCNLISSQPSERAQSVLAEGGFNAALDTMGEQDTTAEHFEDTMRGGVYLEAESAVRNLTDHAPDMARELIRLGVPFKQKNGQTILRNFGGQKKKRTAYTKASTGKTIMTALIDEARKYEAQGLIKRLPHHTLVDIETDGRVLKCIRIRDEYSEEIFDLNGPVILCTGGMNGIFDGMTTGTTQNTGNADALAFRAGVCLSNLEFIQYHPTTVGISNKRMLISEAARGEGGRLYVVRNGKPWYFMEEKYPVLKNLMPRDVVSREMVLVEQEEGCEKGIYLDMTGLEKSVWKEKLSDLRNEIVAYLHLDPVTQPIPVSPGIHFFMGGIRVDNGHESNIKGLFAAGETACKYHGANRLGGNSMLGAMFGGKTAAESAALKATEVELKANPDFCALKETPWVREELRDILLSGLGIVRTPEKMEEALKNLQQLTQNPDLNEMDLMRIDMGIAMVKAAIARKESRGAHYRLDYLQKDEAFRKISCAIWKKEGIEISFRPADAWEVDE